MRVMVKRLLTKYKYPPEGMEDAINTVMSQCEMWTDNASVDPTPQPMEQPESDWGWRAAAPRKTLKDD